MKKIIFMFLSVFILLNVQSAAKVEASDEKIVELGKNYIIKFVQENVRNKNVKLENLKLDINFKGLKNRANYCSFKGNISELNFNSNSQNEKYDFLLILKKHSDANLIKVNSLGDSEVILTDSPDIKGDKERGLSDEERKTELKKYVVSKFKPILEPEIRGVNSTIHFLDGAMSFISKYTVITEDSLFRGSLEFKEFNKISDEEGKFKSVSYWWDIEPVVTEKIPFPTAEEMKDLLKRPLFKEVKKIHLRNGGKIALPLTSKNMSLTFFPKSINNNGVLFEVKSSYKLGLLFAYKVYDLIYEVPLEYVSGEKKWVIAEENLKITKY